MPFVHICPLCGERIKDNDEYDFFQKEHDGTPPRDAHAKCLGDYFKNLTIKPKPN